MLPAWLLALIAALPNLIPQIVALVDQIIAIFGGNPIPAAPNFVKNLQAVKGDLLALDKHAKALNAKGPQP